jgi:hypothetical protein
MLEINRKYILIEFTQIYIVLFIEMWTEPVVSVLPTDACQISTWVILHIPN